MDGVRFIGKQDTNSNAKLGAGVDENKKVNELILFQ